MKFLREYIRMLKVKDPALKSGWEVFLYPSFIVQIYYRIAHFLYLHKHYFWARYFSEKGKRKTGIEIHPGATIGKNLFIDHGSCVVIGETAIIGDNVVMHHGVTLGGVVDTKSKRHPTIEDNVMIGAHAQILGNIVVHKNAKIGAGSIVLDNVDENATIVGVYKKRQK